MAWGTVQDMCHCMPGPRAQHTRGSFSVTWARWHRWHSWGKGADSWCQMCPVCWCQQMCRTQRLFFCQEPQTIWVYSSFPAAALCSPSRDVAVLDRLSFPGSGRWIYSQPIIRWLWLGRCFPAVPPSHVLGVTDTLHALGFCVLMLAWKSLA